MYINAFWIGAISTIIVELGAIITYAIVSNKRKDK